MELKKLPFDKGEFTANGVLYRIKNTLTLARFVEFEKLQNHFGFGLSFKALYDKLEAIRVLFDSGKSVEAFANYWNLKEGIAYRLEDRTHPLLLLCSLFIITEDEDLTAWNELDQKVKIDNWNREGYDVNDFFQLGSNLVAGFLPIYGEISQSSSQTGQKRPKDTVKKQ
jgi:hypothetical protein